VTLFANGTSGAARLRALLAESAPLAAPGCFDALSARVLERAGFRAGFLGGFSVSAARLGLPDVGLLSYGEMLDQARDVCAATSLPIIGDADTGYGNAINAERALLGCARAGLACVMIEDQRWPKRCGHTAGKQVVDRTEAVQRIRACRRTRDEHGLDVLILARTDAIATHGFEEALFRAQAFMDAGADVSFIEAPESLAQMQRYCREVPGPKTANLVEDGRTPWLPRSALGELGYALVLYPVSLLLHSVHAMERAARALASEADLERDGARARFDDVRALVGWDDYEARLRAIDVDANEAEET